MNRRKLISLVGGAAAATWPAVARAQQAMPVIGHLDQRSAETTVDRMRGFHRGLKESGFVEGESVAIIYRWGEGRNESLPELPADLVRRKVAVIVSTGGIPSTMAAKDATTMIPIVFTIPDDPVRIGLVSSLARPNSNLTGVNFLNSEIIAKRLEFLHELVPTATRIAVLVNPANPVNSEATAREAQSAARAMGLQHKVFNASTSREIDAAIAAIVVERFDALL